MGYGPGFATRKLFLMEVEGTHGIADSTGGVGHFGVEDAFLAGFEGIFVDDCFLAGDDFFFGRAEIEDDHQSVEGFIAADLDPAIDCDVGDSTNGLGFQNLDVGGFPRLLWRRRGG